jgi:hypothetical protein
MSMLKRLDFDAFGLPAATRRGNPASKTCPNNNRLSSTVALAYPTGLPAVITSTATDYKQSPKAMRCQVDNAGHAVMYQTFSKNGSALMVRVT